MAALKLFVSCMLYVMVVFNLGYCHIKPEECIDDPVMVNGCSIPWGINFPYKEFFKPACNRHDVCYTCGSKFEWDRLACDNAFKQNMIYLCHFKEKTKVAQKKLFYYSWQAWQDFLNEVKGSWLVGTGMAEWLRLKSGSLEHCLNGVDIYYNAIRNFARKNYELTPPDDCKKSCAKILADPSIGLKNERKYY